MIFFRYVLFIGTFIYTMALNAQQAGIGGLISGPDQQPFDGAVVSLLRAGDSSLVKTTVTESDGRFRFSGLDRGPYVVVSMNVGYTAYSSGVVTVGDSTQTELPPIRLGMAEGTQLKEVQVISKIPLVERKADRTVVNVDAMVSAAGNNVLELLEKAPGVKVDQNGNITMNGKNGVVIYIDDKPTYLSGSDLETYLRSLPASTVKQIELMTNPPAKYDAAGNAGIINIKTKKNNIRGFNGNASAAYRQSRYTRTNNSLNLNYRNNRFNLSSTWSYVIPNRFVDLVINRTFLDSSQRPTSYFSQRSYIKRQGNAGTGRIGLDYYLNDKTTIGLTVNGNLSKSTEYSAITGRIVDREQAPLSTVLADNKSVNTFKNAGFNLNFRHDFDSTGRNLTADLDYVTYTTRVDQHYINYIYGPDGGLNYDQTLSGQLPSSINIYAFKSDYSQPLPYKISLSAGIKSSYTKTDNVASYFNTQDNITTPDYNRSNHFRYEEMINAAYLNLNRNFGRLSVQTGLRGELTRSDGHQLGNAQKPASSFLRHYNNLFPTAYLSYKLDSAAKHQVTFSYGRRIDRPFYQDLNPFISPLDKFTYYVGNPYLKPSFTNNLELSYIFNNLLTVTLYYNKTKDEINETIEIRDGIYYSMPGNIGQSEIAMLNANLNLPVGKWFTTSVYTELGHTKYRSRLFDTQLSSAGNYFFITSTNTFDLGKGWSAELSGDYISNMVSSQFTLGDAGFFTIGVRKKFMKDKAMVRVVVNDVLYTRLHRGVINNLQNTYADYHSKADSRFISFTLSYKFGKVFEQRDHKGNGSESERGRVRD